MIDRVTVRFTDAEKKSLEAKAKEAGVTTAEYVRRIACERPLDYVAVKQYNDLVYEVSRIGNNINQIAHNANSGYYNEAESRRLLANMRVLKELVGKAAEKIGDH